MIINDDFMKWLEGVCDKRLQKKFLVAYNEWLLEVEQGIIEEEKREKQKVAEKTEEKIRAVIKVMLLNGEGITVKAISEKIGVGESTVRRSKWWQGYAEGKVKVSEEEKEKWKKMKEGERKMSGT